MQNRYWELLVQKHFALMFVEEHRRLSIQLKRGYDIFAAVASSSAIAAWAIWNELDYVWAIIIAVFQVASLIWPILPFSKRVEQLEPLSAVWEEQYAEMEEKWHAVAEGQMTETEINKLIYANGKKWEKAEDQFLKFDFLGESRTVKRRADAQNNAHFHQYFGV